MTEPPADRTGDRLRDAYRTVVEAVQPEDIGDLPRPHPQPRIISPARWGRRFAPLAAAAAVVVAISAAVAIPHLTGHGTAATSTTSAPADLGGGQPLFLVDMGGNGTTSIYLEVRNAATGHVLARLTPPGVQGAWREVAATGSPTKFVVGAAYDGNRDYCSSQNYMQLYTLTLTAAGKPTSVTPLYRIPVLAGLSVDTGSRNNISVSADGRTVAYATAPCGQLTSSTVMSIVVIRDGVFKTWTTPWLAGPSSLSLSADGSELGYVDVTETVPAGSLGSVWILPTDSPPGSAARWSHKLYTDVLHNGVQAWDEELSSNGKTMYIVTSTGVQYRSITYALSAYDTATGARLRTLHTWGGLTKGATSLTIGGNEALIWYLHSWVDEVNLTTGAAGRFTPIPPRNSAGLPSFFVLTLAW